MTTSHQFTRRHDHITPIHTQPRPHHTNYQTIALATHKPSNRIQATSTHIVMCQRHGTAVSCQHAKRHCPAGRTRSSQQQIIEVPRSKLVSFGDRSLKVVGPQLWNALPIASKHMVALPLFIKALKMHMLKDKFC